MPDPRSDPFDALRAPVVPVVPDPGFAAGLRARLERAVFDTLGDSMSSSGTTNGSRLRQGDVGYASLWVPDADRAAVFYQDVLGWRYTAGGDPRGRRVLDVVPSHGLWGGQERCRLVLCYQVDDVAAAVARVREAGGLAEEPSLEPYGLTAECTDDQGIPFAVYQDSGQGHAATGSPRQGELVYLTMEVADSARARAFYGATLGWEFIPGRVEDGWEVRIGGTEVRPMIGLAGGSAYGGVVPMYAVDDIGEAVARVRASGGTSSDPSRQPYGITADCADDQGARFFLGQLG